MEKIQSVSVVMCTFQGEKFLKQQLDSLVNQTYPISELIVQDDGSTDETMQVLKHYADIYDYIKVFQNKKSLGVNQNFISAIKKTSGNYIAICDQDDIWELDKIEKQVTLIGNKLLCSGRSKPFSTDNSFAYYDTRSINYNVIRLLFASLPGHTMLFSRAFLDKFSFENYVFNVSMYDSVFGLVAASFNSLEYIDSILVNQRRHTSAATYTDFKKSLPSVNNFLYILWWSIINYSKVKTHAMRYFVAKNDLLNSLNSNEKDFIEAKKIMHLQLQKGIVSKIKLSVLFIKNRKKMFQTPGGGLIKTIRAALYPIMQMYNYRLFLTK